MKSSAHILIADSDENITKITTELLQSEGYHCTTVRDGVEALRALEANKYDLLIAEIAMPGTDELELVRAAQRLAPGMPVIIYTGHPSLRSAIASTQLSVTSYLIKPVPFSVLLFHVRMSIATYHDFIKNPTSAAGLHDCQNERERIDLLENAIEEIIQTLQSTRSAFKSQKLAALRVKLQRLLDRGQPE
jgi:DNA-binding NtrC family response regulator